jgi:hypothetical protein
MWSPQISRNEIMDEVKPYGFGAPNPLWPPEVAELIDRMIWVEIYCARVYDAWRRYEPELKSALRRKTSFLKAQLAVPPLSDSIQTSAQVETLIATRLDRPPAGSSGFVLFFNSRDRLTLAVRMWRAAIDAAKSRVPSVGRWTNRGNLPVVEQWTSIVYGELSSLSGLIPRYNTDTPTELDVSRLERLASQVSSRISELKRIVVPLEAQTSITSEVATADLSLDHAHAYTRAVPAPTSTQSVQTPKPSVYVLEELCGLELRLAVDAVVYDCSRAGAQSRYDRGLRELARRREPHRSGTAEYEAVQSEIEAHVASGVIWDEVTTPFALLEDCVRRAAMDPFDVDRAKPKDLWYRIALFYAIHVADLSKWAVPSWFARWAAIAGGALGRKLAGDRIRADAEVTSRFTDAVRQSVIKLSGRSPLAALRDELATLPPAQRLFRALYRIREHLRAHPDSVPATEWELLTETALTLARDIGLHWPVGAQTPEGLQARQQFGPALITALNALRSKRTPAVVPALEDAMDMLGGFCLDNTAVTALRGHLRQSHTDPSSQDVPTLGYDWPFEKADFPSIRWRPAHWYRQAVEHVTEGRDTLPVEDLSRAKRDGVLKEFAQPIKNGELHYPLDAVCACPRFVEYAPAIQQAFIDKFTGTKRLKQGEKSAFKRPRKQKKLRPSK